MPGADLSSLLPPGHARPTSNLSGYSSPARPFATASSHPNGIAASSVEADSISVTPSRSRPSSPASRTLSNTVTEYNHKRASSRNNSIAASMQIPLSINNSKGSLADFAAQITCLFWFESSFVLHNIEDAKASATPTSPLVSEAIPSLGFRKWVTTILSTTQVSQNVILLALMFIYRLKKLNPTVKGKPGSEFRLLTVALMLGNKFLDDNTYTNKTWAEVSGISVQEIHIMEVEFLSNMRYSLYTSESEWREWHLKLGRFMTYFEKATRTPTDASSRPYGLSSSTLNVGSSLPSPPASNHASPPFVASISPNHPTFPYPLSMPLHLAPSIPSPLASMPEVDLRSTRKRSHDDSSQDSQSKRVLRTSVSAAPPGRHESTTPNYTPSVAQQLPRLPVPNLSISTSQPTNGYTCSTAQLPPPGGRAMSMVFPSQLPGSWPQGTVGHALPAQSHSTPQAMSMSPFREPSHRQSPHPTSSLGSSPTTAMFPPNNLSPSYILTHRNSPYKPVRGVSTLLVPPPSGAIQSTPQHISYPQMHYQPLSKNRNECKTGVVPYMQYDTWSQLPQGPSWPFLPQPNLNG
ncbi:MAG: hypothetical protein M1833_007028 [Piccolia ochrophora]|nr:MAG: hypothetical protein M1833_007028 [Piccolia ochrophora]